MYRRILLTAFLGLALSACVPYYDYDGGSTYYRSEVYTTPAPVYYGGSYYSSGRGYYAPRYYQPAPRYYQPAPRYYQPRYYQSAPRYYQSAPRAVYRAYPNRGWDGHRQGWNNDYRRHDGRRDHDGRRGGRDWSDRGRDDHRRDRHHNR
ncbi:MULTISPECIES: hypothetical protein [Pseudomonas]|jgi:hypothetical protein|uniref:Lipoprotein n=3 Tax=Pseudomonas chlororaphis TaxID=587753 RepID=A0AAP9VX16_9PSED|nr:MULTISPECIES: hypothetical protein [Pseudomonas]AUG39639.1 hypothetical protein CXP47_06995 [Pseudomonas chlororaphis]AZD20745.1 putative lipoprotein [Pseudomonas chlororaphis subsp. aurantiaca]AZD84295.1 putative lipoprotein [Pseudomonas chlororaphis subsp. aureofaciens]AZD90885.1 putative lipoprotein [Pseudomonas chlororaphis subsp. aureofaciens]AZD97355.1 putative lipoprotein [Pseudomonas chlororaphis subsp. aureofaciens]